MTLIRKHPAAPQDGPNPQRLGIGDVVRLRSGGHDMVVVDIDAVAVTVSWPLAGSVEEYRLPARCVDLIVRPS